MEIEATNRRRGVTFSFGDGLFLLNKKPLFVLSGEVHYFRLPRSLWGEHLRKLKEANLNTVSTYIPWDWHEPREGVFDFTGKTHPQRDLHHFIQLVREHGLHLIPKPGPYIIAEYRGWGIPLWTRGKYPDIFARDASGRGLGESTVTLLHPQFLNLVERWYREVLPVLRKNQVRRGGPILLVQLCNESGVIQWLNKECDMSPVVQNLYRAFLLKKYKKIHALNEVHGSDHKGFGSLTPPDPLPVASPALLAAQWDWHEFWRSYYARYLKHLRGRMVSGGLRIPFFHNVPGWISGRALEYPVNQTMYKNVVSRCPNTLLAVDHIPEFLSSRNAHDGPAVQKINRIFQKRNAPLFVAEMQAGTRDHGIPPSHRELETFYRLCLMDGAAGINFYMFSSGINPPGKGESGREFYWNTPLDSRAREGPSYPGFKRLGRLINAFGPAILKAKVRAKVAIGFYPPYYQTEVMPPVPCLPYDLKAMRDTIVFEGLIKTLAKENLDYDVLDVRCSSVRDWMAYDQIWIPTLDFMDKKAQANILKYIRGGGHAFLFPRLPDRDSEWKRGRLLQDALQIRPTGLHLAPQSQVHMGEVRDIPCLNPMQTYTAPRSRVVARTSDGRPCGLSVRCGRGQATVLGTAFAYTTPDHLRAVRSILKKDDITPEAYSDNEYITVRQRHGNGAGFLLVANIHNDEQRGTIYYRDPITRKTRKLARGLHLPPMHSFITPLNYRFGPVLLIHGTSEIVGYEIGPSRVVLAIGGNPGGRGEVLLSSRRLLTKVTFEGLDIPLRRHKDGTFSLEFMFDQQGEGLSSLALHFPNKVIA